MEKTQTELTDKIRSAIKKKLVEINAFVDNELPDYIMILVANKRSKSHMEKDLKLFLGSNTSDFTNWLWDLVSNMKVSSKQKPLPLDENSTSNLGKEENDIEDVLDYDPKEQDSDLEQEETLVATENVKNEEKPKVPSPQPPIEKKSEVVSTVKTVQKSAKVYPVQPVSRTYSSTIHIVDNEQRNEDEYDPTKPQFTGIASSVVKVSQHPRDRPTALQVNKLLLRAVDDATKSVLQGKSINDFYRPTPIDVLSSNKQERNCGSRSHNLVNIKINEDINFESASTVSPEKVLQEQLMLLADRDGDKDIDDILMHQRYALSASPEDYALSSTPEHNRTICFPSEEADLSLSSILRESPDYEMVYKPVRKEVKEPHFIVTLDGVDLPSLKRKYDEVGDEYMDVDEEESIISDEEVEFKKRQKVAERCKYWPACKNNEECAYHHPTIPCKTFPDCKFADKCLFIHPNCKFDALCTRKDCPFTHVSKRNFGPIKAVVKPPRMTRPKQFARTTVCKFYPKCTAKSCPFIHPKPCRYGTKCWLPSCQYSHFNIPSRHQMIWKASVPGPV